MGGVDWGIVNGGGDIEDGFDKVEIGIRGRAERIGGRGMWRYGGSCVRASRFVWMRGMKWIRMFFLVYLSTHEGG